MSQSLKNITIAFVPDDRAIIALMLECLQLFRTKKICVMPDFRRGKLCFIAYIEVGEWFDREAAYNMIKRIQNPLKEARIVYSDDDWWAVEETVAEDLRYTRDARFQKWTTVFNQEPIKEKSLKTVSFKDADEADEAEDEADEAEDEAEDLDIRVVCQDPDFDFDEFCKDFGEANGFDFEAEFLASQQNKLEPVAICE